MALNGYILNADVTVTWDGVSVRLARGTVIDTPASSGSNLAATILAAVGSSLTSLTSQQTSSNNGQMLGVPTFENKTGGGNLPYNAGQC
jgi:hypothetical protein